MQRGACLCGAVGYAIEGQLRAVVDCHCGQCRQFHGHYAAYTAAPRDHVVIHDSLNRLSWYRSSPQVRRGFCNQCGSSLFWDRVDSGLLRIAAGTLTPPTGLSTECHIYVRDAGDYYDIGNDLPKKEQGLDSPEC